MATFNGLIAEKKIIKERGPSDQHVREAKRDSLIKNKIKNGKQIAMVIPQIIAEEANSPSTVNYKGDLSPANAKQESPSVRGNTNKVSVKLKMSPSNLIMMFHSKRGSCISA